jgi:hypothetical protein
VEQTGVELRRNPGFCHRLAIQAILARFAGLALSAIEISLVSAMFAPKAGRAFPTR